jgi:hypothetical protein
MKTLNLKYLLAVFPLITGCFPVAMNPFKHAEVKAHHAVIGKGQEVTFKNPNGSGKIRYVSEFVRQYEIEGKTHDVEMIQRTEEFTYRNGLYNPAASLAIFHLYDSSLSRYVVDESEINFPSMKECKKFLQEGAEDVKWVGNDQGLVVGFDMVPERYQVSVSLFRIRVKGKLLKGVPQEFRYPGYVRIK